MTIHIASELEAFHYAANPFKRTVYTLCGEELQHATEVSESLCDCDTCLKLARREKVGSQESN